MKEVRALTDSDLPTRVVTNHPMEKLSEKLKNSIFNRCGESETGCILIPTDIVHRVIKEMPELAGKDFAIIRSKIIAFMEKVLF